MTVALRSLFESPVIAELIPGYSFRREQFDMALAVDEIISGGTLLLESPCGSGKTLACLLPLIPRILAGNFRAVISTSTITLQQQLLRDLLGPLSERFGFKVMLLQGRNNFLCQRRFEEARLRNELSPDALQAAAWIQRSGGKLESIPGGHIAGELSTLTCEAGLCTSSDCQFYNDCFHFGARREAQGAAVIVVNHALYLADQRTADRGGLPEHDLLILDEAHQLADCLTSAMDLPVSRHLLYRLAHQLDRMVATRNTSDPLRAEPAIMVAAAETFFQDLESRFSSRKDRFLTGDRDRAWFDVLPSRRSLLMALERLQEIPVSFRNQAASSPVPMEDRLRDVRVAIENLAVSSSDYFYWGEMVHGTTGLVIHHAPYRLENAWQTLLADRAPAMVLTSGTLTWKNSFDWFKSQFNLQNTNDVCFSSEADGDLRRICYTDPDMPSPKHGSFYQALLEKVETLVHLLDGRVLVLFTSLSLMRSAASELRLPLDLAGRSLLMQGEQSREETVRLFSSTPRSVLFASVTWWEGVELKGQPLRGLILTRLPFQVPDDPVVRARSEWIKQQGQDSFSGYFLPAAAIRLRQGIGRLIRDRREWGVAAILDSRLLTASWGRTFLDEFKGLELVTDLSQVTGFIEGNAA